MRLTDYSSESSENTYSQMASTDFGMQFYNLGKYQTSFLENRCHKTEGFHSCFLHPESNLKTQTDFRKLFIFSITQIIISIIILSISQNTRLCHPLTRKKNNCIYSFYMFQKLFYPIISWYNKNKCSCHWHMLIRKSFMIIKH